MRASPTRLPAMCGVAGVLVWVFEVWTMEVVVSCDILLHELRKQAEREEHWDKLVSNAREWFNR